MKLQFKSHSIEKNIDWTWTEMDKAYWDTWVPKKSDLKNFMLVLQRYIVSFIEKQVVMLSQYLMSYGKIYKFLYNLYEIETMQEEEQKDLHKNKKYDRLQTLNTKTKTYRRKIIYV